MKAFTDELSYAIKINKGRYIFFILYMIFISVGACLLARFLGASNIGFAGVIYGKILQGYAIFDERDDYFISLPAGWIILVSFIPYLFGNYIESDMREVGKYRLIQYGRKRWWHGKIIWMIITLLIYVLTLNGTALLVSFAMNGYRIAKPANDSMMHMMGFSDFVVNNKEFLIYTFIVPALCIFAIGIWTLVLGMIIGSTLTFIVEVIYFTLGIYYFNPLFIGNQLMLLRSAVTTDRGLRYSSSIIIDIILIICGYLIGRKYVKEKDFI